MNRKYDSSIEAHSSNKLFPGSKYNSPSFTGNEKISRPLRTGVGASKQASEYLVVPKRNDFAVASAQSTTVYQDFTVPISAASTDPQLRKQNKRLLQKPVLRHLSEKSIIVFPESSNHKMPMRRHFSDNQCIT